MAKVGVGGSSGGERGSIPRMRNQMRRLLAVSVELVPKSPHGESRLRNSVTEQSHLAWDPRQPGMPALFESRTVLGRRFFKEIIAHPVPLDMGILRALSKSPLGLDLYAWLVYRTFTFENVRSI